MKDSGLWEEVVSTRWQLPEGREVRSTSWREHGRARRRGSTHCIAVAVDGEAGSLRWNWDACDSRKPVLDLMGALWIQLMVLSSATVWLLASVHVHRSCCLVRQAFVTTKTTDALSRHTGWRIAMIETQWLVGGSGEHSASESRARWWRRSARLRTAWWKRNLRNVSHVVGQ